MYYCDFHAIPKGSIDMITAPILYTCPTISLFPSLFVLHIYFCFSHHEFILDNLTADSDGRCSQSHAYSLPSFSSSKSILGHSIVLHIPDS